jgi:DNA end-binding protein Ku
LAARFVEAIAAPFRPEEFTDRYREQLESLIASKDAVLTRGMQQPSPPATGKVVDIMEALRKSLEAVKKPPAKAEGSTRTAVSKKRLRR